MLTKTIAQSYDTPPCELHQYLKCLLSKITVIESFLDEAIILHLTSLLIFLMLPHLFLSKVFQGLMLIVPPAQKLQIVRQVTTTKGERDNMIDLNVPC